MIGGPFGASAERRRFGQESAATFPAWANGHRIGERENEPGIRCIASLHAMEGMFIEWRRMERTGLRRAQESVAPLFERTRRFLAYDSWLAPGLLQTAAYTSAFQDLEV